MDTLTEQSPTLAGIHDVLCRLGITPNYTGYFHTSHAVLLAIQDPQRLLLITKWIYPEVAKHYDTTCKAVERNIRSAVNIAWKCNPELLGKLSGFQLVEKPKNAQFLAILATHCSQGCFPGPAL